MRSAAVFHPLHGFAMCWGGYSAAPAGFTSPEHGTLVSCRMCGRLGVLPEPGHELKFLPPGTEYGPDGKTFILRFAPPD